MGNPNVGKSAVFSRLTGANVIASNYPGTTVDFTKGIMRVAGSGGPVDITANPQIVAGVDGQVVIIQGTNDTNTVQLDDGDGLSLSASIVLGQNDNITLMYDSGESLWIETSRTLV